jgi:hypothetical protein
LPTIVASPSPIARLLNDSNDLANINMLLHNANQMFSEENIEQRQQHPGQSRTNHRRHCRPARRHRAGHQATGASRQAGQRHAGADHR